MLSLYECFDIELRSYAPSLRVGRRAGFYNGIYGHCERSTGIKAIESILLPKQNRDHGCSDKGSYGFRR